MRSYKGQSLAVVFVLLVIGSIIGFALYSRFSQESRRTVDEKASAEANELTETVVGLISTSTYEKLTSQKVLDFFTCTEDDLGINGCRRSEVMLSELEDFFARMDLEVDFSDFDFSPGYCSSELAMRYSLDDDEVTIEQDYAYSVFVSKVNWDSCEIDFVMTNNGNSDGFVLSTFYGKYDGSNNLTSYKPYEFDDIVGFSYSNLGGNWTSYDSGLEVLKFSKSEAFKVDSKLDEIRFKSLGGSSNLRWSLSEGGCDVEGYLLMEVGSTCGGQYVGKNFVVPGEVFAPPIFDYVLFNGTGKLIPEAIQRD